MKKKILLSLFSLLFVLVAGELFVRNFLRYKDFDAWRKKSIRYAQDGCFGWKMEPGTYENKRGGIHINALGLRGREIPLQKPSGEFRILVLGGSATFNSKAEGRKTWPRLLEMKLQDRFGPDVAVLNAGTPGYSAFQSHKRLECDLLQLSPDLVLVYHLWNDVKYFWWSDAPALTRHLLRQGEFNQKRTLMLPAWKIPVVDELTRYSQLVARLRFSIIKALIYTYRIRYEGPGHETLNKQIEPNGVNFYRENLLGIRKLLAERSVPFVIVKQGSLIHSRNVSEERNRIGYAYTGFEHDVLVEAVQTGWAVNDELCTLEDVSCVAANEELPAELDYFRDHVHLQQSGLEILSEVVFQGIAGLIEEKMSDL